MKTCLWFLLYAVSLFSLANATNYNEGVKGDPFNRLVPQSVKELLRLGARQSVVKFDYLSYLKLVLMLSDEEIKEYDVQYPQTSKLLKHKNLRVDSKGVRLVNMDSIQGHRPFELLVLFTFVSNLGDKQSRSLMRQCPDCEPAQDIFIELARRYKAEQKTIERDIPVIFGIVNAGDPNSSSIASLHPPMLLPMLLHFPSFPKHFTADKQNGFVEENQYKEFFSSAVESLRGVLDSDTDIVGSSSGGSVRDDSESITFFQLQPKEMLLLKQRKSDLEMRTRMRRWINMRTGSNIEEASVLAHSSFKLLLIVGLLLLTGSILLCVMTMLVRKFPVIMVIGGFFLYMLFTSGAIFSIIHQTSISGVDSTGKNIWMAPTPRMQFWLEGFVMSGCCSIFSIAAALIICIPNKFNLGQMDIDNYDQPNGSKSTKNYSKPSKRRSVATIFFFILTSCVLVLSAAATFSAYRVKAPWYKPYFFPPRTVAMGPMRNDRGNMF